MGIRNIITRLKMGRGDADNRFPYDENMHEAVIRCSICTGEQVAGFKNRQDGSFVGVMVIQSEKDLEYFKRLYRVDDVRKIY
jgi:hypothetical protein